MKDTRISPLRSLIIFGAIIASTRQLSQKDYGKYSPPRRGNRHSFSGLSNNARDEDKQAWRKTQRLLQRRAWIKKQARLDAAVIIPRGNRCLPAGIRLHA